MSDTPAPPSPLVLDLKRLCVGRGVHHRSIAGRLGPDIRAACGVLQSDGAVEARRKVITRIEECAGHLPLDVRVAALAILCVHPDAQLKFTRDRLAWLAKYLGRDARTARRRADEGLTLLAELLGDDTPRPASRFTGDLTAVLGKLDAARDAIDAAEREVRTLMAEHGAGMWEGRDSDCTEAS